MAYVYDPNDQQNQEQPNSANQTPQNQAPTISAGGNEGSGAPTAQDSGKKGSGFQNLDQYLNVNAPNAFGSQVAGKVGANEDLAGQAQAQASSAGKNLIDQNTVNANPDLVNKAVSNPTGFVSDPNNVSQFQNQLNANYQGPKVASDIGDYNKAVGSTKSATEQAKAFGTEGGRFALLDQFYGRPDYSFGQKSLDNLLIQKDPNAQQPIQQVQQNAQSLQANVPRIGNELNNAATAAAAKTANTANAARSALGVDSAGNPITDSTLQGYNPKSAYANLDNYLNTNFANTQGKNSAVQSAVQAFQNSYGDPNVDRNQLLANLGLDSGTAAPLSAFNHTLDTVNGLGVGNANLSNVLNQLARGAVSFNPGSGVDKYGAASPEKQAELAALGQLSGHPYTAPTGYTPAGAKLNSDLGTQANNLASEIDTNFQKYFNPSAGYNSWEEQLGRNFGTTKPDTSSLTNFYNYIKPYVGAGGGNQEADSIAKMYQALQAIRGTNPLPSGGGLSRPPSRGGL